jgi:hypothetical protein
MIFGRLYRLGPLQVESIEEEVGSVRLGHCQYRTETVMGRPVVHFEIEGLDAAKLRDFYSSLFDSQIHVDLSNPAEYGMIDASSSGLGRAVSRVPDEPSSTWEGKTRAE